MTKCKWQQQQQQQYCVAAGCGDVTRGGRAQTAGPRPRTSQTAAVYRAHRFAISWRAIFLSLEPPTSLASATWWMVDCCVC